MLKRKDFKVITIAGKTRLDNSSHEGILISKNKQWLYLWKVVDFRIDGRILVRRSEVFSYGQHKMSKFQYRAMKTLGEFDKINSESEVQLPKSDKKILKKIANKTSAVINTDVDDYIGDIKKIGDNRITFQEYTPKGKTRLQCAYIEDVCMLHINSELALTYSLFSK